MRRLVLVAVLMLPLVGAAITLAPTAAACTPPVCQVQNCDLIFERPQADVKTQQVDLGLVGVDCTEPSTP